MQHLDDRCANRMRSKVMCAELGHANIAMTLDLYSHATADMQRHQLISLKELRTRSDSGHGMARSEDLVMVLPDRPDYEQRFELQSHPPNYQVEFDLCYLRYRAVPGIRVAVRDDARADDVAWVVRSIDELYRIILWVERDNVEAGYPRLVLRRNATWRSIQPLRLDEVSSGSSLFDFVTPELVNAVLASTVILRLISILERALFQRGHRLAMNEVQLANAREDLTAKRIANIQAASLLPREVAQEQPGQQQVQGVGQLLTPGETEMLDTRVENASMELIEERLERIVNRTTLGPEVLPLIVQSPLRTEEVSPQTLAALDDATKALARLENIQTKRTVVLYVEYLE